MPGAHVTSGERVTLRTVESEDVPFLQRSIEPEIRYPLGNPVRNRDQYEATAEDGTDRFLVCLEDDSEALRVSNHASGQSPRADDTDPGQPNESDVRRLGVVSVEDADYKRPELGYWLVPEVHGEGYGKEAVALAIEYAFRQYDAPAVGAGAYDYNDASRGLLESLGFVEEGRRRKYMFVDGEHRDMVQYGLLREEWKEHSE